MKRTNSKGVLVSWLFRTQFQNTLSHGNNGAYTEDQSLGSPQTYIHHILGVTVLIQPYWSTYTMVSTCVYWEVPGAHHPPGAAASPGCPETCLLMVQDTVPGGGGVVAIIWYNHSWKSLHPAKSHSKNNRVYGGKHREGQTTWNLCTSVTRAPTERIINT